MPADKVVVVIIDLVENCRRVTASGQSVQVPLLGEAV
jgi:hypothetical protein